GRAKEWVGDKTDNERLEAEGTADRAKGNAKQFGEHVKDAAEDAGDALR
ncbi:MAG: general stress protein CsbD, partial [Actinobacteria bacterium 13_1_20CM_3_71_11]